MSGRELQLHLSDFLPTSEMPKISLPLAKNILRRALVELVDPGPTKRQTAEMWAFFESACAYCGRSLVRGGKDAHIDHLVPASRGGSNHLGNRVLACARCNEHEKREMGWEDFLLQKSGDPGDLELRLRRILNWQQIHVQAEDPTRTEAVAAALAAADRVSEQFNREVMSLREQHASKGAMARRARSSRSVRAEGPRPQRSACPERALPTYSVTRLTFKADIIEPLQGNDWFRVRTPEGTFEMTKDQFYHAFPNVVLTRSYREHRLYHYPRTPEHAYQFLVASELSNEL